MSNNARAAYASGSMPASKAAKEFGFKTASDLRQCITSHEWHHTSKEYNSTDFYDVNESISDADWKALIEWRSHMTKRGWQGMRGEIRAKLRTQWMCAVELKFNRHSKGRQARLWELATKYPTPFQRHNGEAAVWAVLHETELTDANYIAAKAVVDARREAKAAKREAAL